MKNARVSSTAWRACDSSPTRDVASAEDALGNALVAALTAWPRDGVPQNHAHGAAVHCRNIVTTPSIVYSYHCEGRLTSQ